MYGLYVFYRGYTRADLVKKNWAVSLSGGGSGRGESPLALIEKILTACKKGLCLVRQPRLDILDFFASL